MVAANWLRQSSGLYLPGFSGLNRFSLGCCCASTPSCTIFADDFNRADDTDIGSDWTEVSGDFSIASNKLSITATTSAKVTTTVSHSASAITLAAEVTSSSSGDEVRLYIGSNYAEVVFSGGSGSLNVNGDSTAPGKVTVTLTAGMTYTMTFCISEAGQLVATINGQKAYKGVSPASSGVSFGIGTGSTHAGTATFDTFTSQVVSSDCESCFSCEPCTGTVQASVTLTIAGATNGYFNASWVLPLIYVAVDGTACVALYRQSGLDNTDANCNIASVAAVISKGASGSTTSIIYAQFERVIGLAKQWSAPLTDPPYACSQTSLSLTRVAVGLEATTCMPTTTTCVFDS